MDLTSIFKFLRLDNLVSNLTGYVETRVELLKVEVREEVVKVVSHGLMISVCVLLTLLFLIFLSVGLANYISEQYGTSFTGYWFVAGAYALICLIIILFRKNIGLFIESYLKEQTQKGK
ncbi:MAG TPA: phage holin family protein [Cyclobacteriaceae bacterium]|jgi:uncharacterized membrane protein YqjE|nr:phage holin family protein [Cyclobacteriaceae bacterium]